MVDVAKFFMEFCMTESCGKCVPCRVGTVQLNGLLGRITDGRAPEWADGWNDGSIRVPVQGLERPTPRLIKVLRHELAHSFVTARTGNNCPTWLQEGIAQWLEGGDPAREDAQLQTIARAGRLQSLLTLEGPFRGLGEADANLAYGQSLSAVNHILRTSGEAGFTTISPAWLAAPSRRRPAHRATAAPRRA